ncbi:hypothetical protein Tco_1026658, partial [Tanacetum coccineum]
MDMHLQKLIKSEKKLEQNIKSTKLEGDSRIGRKISDIDKVPTIYLVQGEGTTCFRMMQRFSRRLVVILRFFLIKKSLLSLWKILVVEKRVKKRLVLLMFQGSTASAISKVSTAGRQVYIRRSAKKRKDKGKAVMQESDLSKKIKKRVQVQMSVDEELAQKLHEEEKASDHAVIRYHALQNRSRSVAEVRKNMCIYLKNQGGYKMSHFKGMSYDDIRPIFENVWDQIHSFMPMDSDEKKDDSNRKSAGKGRKKTLARKRAGGKDTKESYKKQKLEDDTEKEELKTYLDIVQKMSLLWKANGSSKNYTIFSEMLDDFDRRDVVDLHRLVEERNQHEYNLISWRLCDSSGMHILLMENGIAIYMMVEKKYPLTQEMISKMLNRRLEVGQEREMAFELL